MISSEAPSETILASQNEQGPNANRDQRRRLAMTRRGRRVSIPCKMDRRPVSESSFLCCGRERQRVGSSVRPAAAVIGFLCCRRERQRVVQALEASLRFGTWDLRRALGIWLDTGSTRWRSRLQHEASRP